jgi:hypothetical protein
MSPSGSRWQCHSYCQKKDVLFGAFDMLDLLLEDETE